MKTLLTLLFCLAGVSSSIAQTSFTFGSADFSVVYTGYTTSQTEKDLTLTGITSNELYGTLSKTVDLSSYNFSSSIPQITLTASITSTSKVDSSFSIYFFDSAGGYALYSGNWSSFSSTFLTQTLTYVESSGDFSGKVSSISINGSGYDSATITLDSISISTSAIPEPTTFAALAGVAALGLALWNRRGPRQLETPV